MRGIDKARLIAVWDGKSETSKDLDARLVKHMVDLMRDTGGIVEHINPYKLSADLLEATAPVVETAPINAPLKKEKPEATDKPKNKKKK